MTDNSEDLADQTPPAAAPPRKRRLRRALAVLGLVLLALLAIVWVSRERIADNVIASQLREMGLPATYRIERIGGSRQVLADVKIGDPARPDLTIERAEVVIGYTIGLPRIVSVRLEKPRLYGSYRGGKLTFGSLDKVLFAPRAPGEPPARLPDLRLDLVDGRAQLLTDYGPVGFKADGTGNLRNGFAGSLAAIAPQLTTPRCTARGATAYGAVRISGEAPRFSGPVRLAALRCPGDALAIDSAAVELEASTDKDFRSFTADARLRSRQLVYGASRANSLALDGKATWKDGALNGRLVGDLGGVQTNGVVVALLGIDGQFRARDGFASSEFRGSVDGSGIAQGPALDRSLASAQKASAATLLEPIIGQVRAALQRERAGSRLTADLTWRQTGQLWSLVVPTALLKGGSGEGLLALSRFQIAGGRTGTAPLLSGNFSTGGPGLPRIAGRMERGQRGEALFRLSMAPYRAGNNELALPEMTVRQADDGSLGFAGEVRLSGALPGGYARNLVMPLDGYWSAGGELAVFRQCVTPRFDELALAGLVIERRSITLCPATGGAIVRSGAGGLRIAAGAPSLDVAGRFGATPIRIRSGPVGLAWPGAISAHQLDISLGPVDTATRFRLTNLVAKLGSDVSGSFDGAEAQLFAVPLDIVEAAGQWRYAGQRLSVTGGSFRLLDRKDPDRFNPMVARDATLSLFANRIDAAATLREPGTDREVVRTVIRHDLSSGRGHADLAVDSLTFDKALQPDRITPLALGVVANVAGTVRGTGVVDWNERGVTSSGAFSSDNLDLAAAFGPVKGLSGTVRFADLLGLVTEPNQRVHVASINPGIEVTDGDVDFAILPNYLLRVNGGKWPFLGGTLALEPVDLNLGMAETRRYVLVIAGLDAAKFLQNMDLENISASGTFDGKMPLVFDANGGRIEGGLLTSRPPGGNVSYVGALTYEDLSTMANFAFDALKSLDYQYMTIGVDGALEGDIVTRVRFDGVKQGAGAKRNIATRAIGKLPIQFNINIKAPFYRLITSVKAFYDPAFIEDPRTLGLVDKDGNPVRGTGNGVRDGGQPVLVLPGTPTKPAASGAPAEPGRDVQPPESGKLP